MNIRPRRRRSTGVDITPLIDVVFLLLIFFMVSTTFERETQITIELPEATGEKSEQLPDELEITIDRHGVFYVNKLEVINTRLETLKMAIRKAVGEKRDIPVIINADAKTPHQAVMTVMDAASQMGLLHMTFTAQQPNE
ncbi:MAG: biopolymer transporter ExbD [Pseudomonadota bacterium]